MDVLCEFIAKTQPKEWAKYNKYYGVNAADKLYHRLETTISNQGRCMSCAMALRTWVAN